MFRINDHYLKLKAGYLFPEIGRRVEAYRNVHPDAAERIIRCGIGDVTEPLPLAVREAMKRAVDDLSRHETFHGYGPATGYDWLRNAIVENDFRARGINVQPDEIFLSDGSKVDCSAILDVLDPGRANAIAVADPVYPVYVDSNVMVGHTDGASETDGRYGGLTYLPATPANGFVPEIPEAKLDVIYLCYPNNPTGGTITHAQLDAWVQYACKHNSLILFDAAYEAYITDESLPRSIFEIDGADRCAIEFRSFSKNGGFTGVRCGYTVVPHALMGSDASGRQVALNPLWTRRWATKSNGVSYIVQRGAEALYSDEGKQQVKSLVDHYLSNARTLRDGCLAIGLEVYGGENAPYVWVACPDGVDSWQMFNTVLEQAQVVVTPGSGFGRMGEGFFRISAFNSKANVQEVVRRLQTLGAVATRSS
ncbi:MAG: LL-diaminopimelate aminotransferase [Phycisphaerales bacterium]